MRKHLAVTCVTAETWTAMVAEVRLEMSQN